MRAASKPRVRHSCERWCLACRLPGAARGGRGQAGHRELHAAGPGPARCGRGRLPPADQPHAAAAQSHHGRQPVRPDHSPDVQASLLMHRICPSFPCAPLVSLATCTIYIKTHPQHHPCSSVFPAELCTPQSSQIRRDESCHFTGHFQADPRLSVSISPASSHLTSCVQALHAAFGGVLCEHSQRPQHYSLPKWRAKVTQDLQLLHPLRRPAVLRGRQSRSV